MKHLLNRKKYKIKYNGLFLLLCLYVTRDCWGGRKNMWKTYSREIHWIIIVKKKKANGTMGKVSSCKISMLDVYTLRFDVWLFLVVLLLLKQRAFIWHINFHVSNPKVLICMFPYNTGIMNQFGLHIIFN